MCHNGQSKPNLEDANWVESLLEIVVLEVLRLVHIHTAGRRQFQIVGTATLKLQATDRQM